MNDHSLAFVMTPPPDTSVQRKTDDPSAIDWAELKERIREAIRTVIQERANEFGLSWNDYVDRLRDCEHEQDEGDGPAHVKAPASQ